MSTYGHAGSLQNDKEKEAVDIFLISIYSSVVWKNKNPILDRRNVSMEL